VAKMQISQRDRVVLVLGAITIVLMLGVFLARKPLKIYRESKQAVIDARLRLSDTYDTRALILDEQNTAEQFKKVFSDNTGGRGLTLLINQTLQDTNLTGKAEFQQVNSALGREAGKRLDTVQVNLRGVSLKQLIDLLYGLYSKNKLLILERLEYLRPSRDNVGLDVLMVFSALKTA